MIIEIEHFHEDNKNLVRVPLVKSDLKATLFEDDFNDLVAIGVSPKWRMYHNQIVARNNGQYVAIARLIRHAGAGQRVVYKDDDVTNLRKDNLVLGSGPSKYEARHNVVRAFKDRTVVEHVGAGQ